MSGSVSWQPWLSKLANRLKFRMSIKKDVAVLQASLLTILTVLMISPLTVHGQDSPNSQRDGSNTLALVHVGVVDVINGSVLPDQTVVVTGNRITAIGPAGKIALPTSARKIDSADKYVIPGLWDMHVHLGNATEAALPALVASGITTVRDMGSPSYETLKQWGLQALKGERIGPRIFAAGPIIDSGAPDANRYIVRSLEEGRHAVDVLWRRGVDFIKVHEHLSRETYFAIADEARLLGIPFVEHVPAGPDGFAISATEASNAGQKSLEPFYGSPFDPGDPSVAEMLNTLKANETRVCPTLIVFWNRAHLKELAQADAQLPRTIAPALKAFWDSQLKDFSPDLRVPAILLSARRANTKLLSQAQIPLLAGTDLGFAYVRPGDLLKELGLLVEAGLSPAEALRAATVN